MPFFSIFYSSAVLAVVAAFALLNAMMPHGEGAFGIAKVAPLIFIVLVPVCFCLIWFPANLLVWFCLEPEKRGPASHSKPVFLFSGTIFGLVLSISCYLMWPGWFHQVHFYYKLEDQFGQPVPNARIRSHAQWEPANRQPEQQCDANGFFEITCGPGQTFAFTPIKEGYALASGGTTASYSEKLQEEQKAAPSTIDRVVVKMWKMQGAEPLVFFKHDCKLPNTLNPINFDLLTGKAVDSGGDFKITIHRPTGEISERHPQKWSADLEAVAGGFIDADSDEFRITYSAPKEGYRQKEMLWNNNGTAGLDHAFFLKSREGQIYSKVGFIFEINEGPNTPMYITVSGLANTNGSGNWEGDPHTMAAVH